MRRLLSRLVIFAVLAGIALQGLRALGLLKGGECSPACGCSTGDPACTCGHATCLSPAVG
jgi:hypothetical protein